MINLEKCNNIFVDFDGVIIDSNKFKESAIEKSIIKCCGKNEDTFRAIEYFNINAGISRKKKLSLFFKDYYVNKIMEIYSQECKTFFSEKEPTNGFYEFLNFIKKRYKNINIFILSGGEKNEIKFFLEKNNLLQFFEGILASDKTKFEHIKNMEVSGNDIFIGDSKNDFKTSLKTGLKFVLFYGYKSIHSYPKEEFIKNKIFFKTKNFETLLSKIVS